MTFAHPILLLGLIPVLILGWLGYRSARKTQPGIRFSATNDAAEVPQSVWVRLRGLPSVLLFLSIALGILALTRPQERDVVVERTAEGIDIMMALDVSRSMLERDFYPNRFEAAKVVASDFVDGRVSDRIGLVVFSGEAYTQAPLTLDYSFLKRMLRDVQTGLIKDGTAIGTAIATATARLRESDAVSKIIILLTDGENNAGSIDPSTAADLASALNVKIYSIGVGGDGTSGGGSMFDQFLGPASQVDEETLRNVAERSGGRYFRARDAEALRSIYEAISELEKTEIEESSYVDVEERYAWFLWPAAGSFLLHILLVNTRLRRVP